MNTVPRIVRDGKVAVIYHPGAGLGWYTTHHIERLLFSPEIVEIIERGGAPSEIHDLCVKENHHRALLSLCKDLQVGWIPVSQKFRIHESNGAEKIVCSSDLDDDMWWGKNETCVKISSWFSSAMQANQVPRVIRDGKVAVLYHPGVGYGWYTFHLIERLLFSPEIVEMVERGATHSEIREYCVKQKYHGALPPLRAKSRLDNLNQMDKPEQMDKSKLVERPKQLENPAEVEITKKARKPFRKQRQTETPKQVKKTEQMENPADKDENPREDEKLSQVKETEQMIKPVEDDKLDKVEIAKKDEKQNQIQIAWVPVTQKFRIHSCKGSEKIIYPSDLSRDVWWNMNETFVRISRWFTS